MALHLAPGAFFTLVYALLAQPAQRLGLNNLLTFNLLAVLVLVPLELGVLFAVGKKKTGRFSLAGVVLNREHLPLGQLLGLAPADTGLAWWYVSHNSRTAWIPGCRRPCLVGCRSGLC